MAHQLYDLRHVNFFLKQIGKFGQEIRTCLLSRTMMQLNLVPSNADRLPLHDMQLQLCASPVLLPVSKDNLTCCVHPRLPPINRLQQNAVQVDLCRSFALDPQHLQRRCTNIVCFNLRCRFRLLNPFTAYYEIANSTFIPHPMGYESDSRCEACLLLPDDIHPLSYYTGVADWTDFWGTVVNYKDGAAPSSNRRLHRHLLQVTQTVVKLVCQ